MNYSVKEIFYTLQGEGANAGRPAVFLRFAGCNLWSGRESDRATAACTFCDTDFVGIDGSGGGRFASAAELANAVRGKWPAKTSRTARPLVVCTGGEPLLQLDDAAVAALHEQGFEVAVETNGTCAPPAGVDWICVSPKANIALVLKAGNELKFVFPQNGVDPAQFEELDFQVHYLQPMDGPNASRNTQLATQYCLDHPRWRLSLQTHKLLCIP
jgi:7-carboxy-7-deazaguanine synthase